MGLEGILPFLNAVNFPVLACNLNISDQHPLMLTKALKKSTVFDVNGNKVGVIGYVLPETKQVTPPSDVEFFPEVKAIK